MIKNLLAVVLFLFIPLSIPTLAFEKSTPAEVSQAVASGHMVLIDIRRPDEWAATGIAASARPIDMRDKAFLSQIQAIATANPNLKIALICHSGVRSNWLAAKLEDLGINGVVDVAGGMAGNSENPGWIAQGLPLRQP